MSIPAKNYSPDVQWSAANTSQDGFPEDEILMNPTSSSEREEDTVSVAESGGTASPKSERPRQAGLVERIARIIDPDAWEPFSTVDIFRLDAWRQSSLRKAKRVLAALDDSWQPIDSFQGHGVVMVARPAYTADQFGPVMAFIDATGVWRVFLSEGGMSPLPFAPTHWMRQPTPPEAAS